VAQSSGATKEKKRKRPFVQFIDGRYRIHIKLIFKPSRLHSRRSDLISTIRYEPVEQLKLADMAERTERESENIDTLDHNFSIQSLMTSKMARDSTQNDDTLPAN